MYVCLFPLSLLQEEVQEHEDLRFSGVDLFCHRQIVPNSLRSCGKLDSVSRSAEWQMATKQKEGEAKEA